MRWRTYEEEVVGYMEAKVHGEAEKRLQMLNERCYQVGVSLFGEQERKQQSEKKARNSKLQMLKKEKNRLHKCWKRAKVDQKEGIQVLWEEVKKRYKEELTVCKRREKRKGKELARKQFLKDPFKFAKSLFTQKCSGMLEATKEELEGHLRAVYCDVRRSEELDMRDGFVRPSPPGHVFETGELRWHEVTEFVKKARAGSCPGNNGIPYKVLKRCPRVLKELWKVLRVLWRKRVIADSWCSAEGVFIPKEGKSERIEQFRPISLLNVDGKIFFGILAKRLTDFVMTNGCECVSAESRGARFSRVCGACTSNLGSHHDSKGRERGPGCYLVGSCKCLWVCAS